MHLAWFSQNTPRLFLPKKLWKYASTTSFRKHKRKGALVLIYLFSYNSSKSTIFMLNIAFIVILSKDFFSNKLEFFVSYNKKITRTSFFLAQLPSGRQTSFGRAMEVYMKPGLHIAIHWTSKGRLMPTGCVWNTFVFCFRIPIKFTLSAIISTMKTSMNNISPV